VQNNHEEIMRAFDANQEAMKIQAEADMGFYYKDTNWSTLRTIFEEFLKATTAKVVIMKKPTMLGENRLPVFAKSRKLKWGFPTEDLLENLNKHDTVYVYCMLMTPILAKDNMLSDPTYLIRYGWEEEKPENGMTKSEYLNFPTLPDPEFGNGRCKWIRSEWKKADIQPGDMVFFMERVPMDDDQNGQIQAQIRVCAAIIMEG